jgi:hypothetical protein
VSLPGNLTFSFIKLQRLAASFDELCDGSAEATGQRGAERTLVRLVRELGTTAVPLLVRKLGSPRADAARWAGTLLGQLADDAGARDRVLDAVRACATASGSNDRERARAQALLADLDGEGVAGNTAVRDRSLRELARCLESPAEVARAADLLLPQLAADEPLEVLDAFGTSEADRAAALLDELLVRDDLDERTRSELRRLRAPLRVERRPAPTATRARPAVQVAVHPDGRELVVAIARRGAARPPRYRAFGALADEEGTMLDAG